MVEPAVDPGTARRRSGGPADGPRPRPPAAVTGAPM